MLKVVQPGITITQLRKLPKSKGTALFSGLLVISFGLYAILRHQFALLIKLSQGKQGIGILLLGVALNLTENRLLLLFA